MPNGMMVMQSFYRKYRPQSFSQIVGQTTVVKILTGAIKQGTLSHAYLFSGPRGSGKTSTARILAKTLNCMRKNAPCNECENCLEITKGTSLDVIELDAASNRGIDEIKNLIGKVSFSPAKSKFKVYIIDEAHMLTKEAFNALLKTLEEPPSHAVFILATTEIHKIPPTILSRCQGLDFKRSGLDDLKKYINIIIKSEKLKIEDTALTLIAQAADGSLRDSATILEQVASISLGKITIENVEFSLGLVMQKEVMDFFENIFNKNVKKCLNGIEDLVYSGYNIGLFIQKCIGFLRLYYLSYFQIKETVIIKEESDFIEKYKETVSIQDVIQMIKVLIEAKEQTNSAYISQLPLEIAIFEIIDNISRLDQKLETRDQKHNLNFEKMSVKKTTIKTTNDVVSKKRNVISRDAQNDEPSQSLSTSRDEKAGVPVSPSANAKQSPNPSSNNPLTIDLLINNWLNILSEIKKVNHSLISLLESVVPFVIKQNNILFLTKYKFSAQKLTEVSKKHLFEDVIDKYFNGKFIAKFEMATDTNKEKFKQIRSKISEFEKNKDDQLLNDAKEVFEI